MKQLIFIVAGLVMLSCNNSSASDNSPGTPKSDAAPASTTSAAHKGIITCLIDGQQKTFNVNSNISEISLGADIDGPKDGLEISSEDKKEGFTFEFKKSDTTKIPGDMNCIINYYNPQIITYTGKDVTIVVTSYDQTHLTGTFSGKLVNVYYEDTPCCKKLSVIHSNNRGQV